MAELNAVRVGASGFSAEGWVGTFYPGKMKGHGFPLFSRL